MFIRKKKLLAKIRDIREIAQKDADKTTETDSYAYYQGIVDCCNNIIFEYDTWGS